MTQTGRDLAAGTGRHRVGVYPGTFDPLTLGHLDIIRRASTLVDRLVIGVATNMAKVPMFTDAERIAMTREAIAGMDCPADAGEIVVTGFRALLMHFARDQGASVIIRGLRAVADFEYEYQMAGMNQQLGQDVETIFLMADVGLQPIASRLVKEIALFGGDIAPFVTAPVQRAVMAKVAAAAPA